LSPENQEKEIGIRFSPTNKKTWAMPDVDIVPRFLLVVKPTVTLEANNQNQSDPANLLLVSAK